MAIKTPPVHTFRTRRARLLTTALLLAGCAGCSGSSSDGVSSGTFALLAISVTDGQTWEVNRPIRFTFNQSVDFDTVNRNTIVIQPDGGLPAMGDFVLDSSDVDPADGLPRSVIFQPVCPTRSDFSDAGLLPGGAWYQIDVPDLHTGSTTVRSLRSGKALEVGGRTLAFRTPTSNVLADLFFDTVLGPPTPLLKPTNAVSCRLELIDAESGEVIAREFNQQPDGSGRLEDGYLVPNNLYSAIETQVTIYLELNQAVSPTLNNIDDSRLKLEYRTLDGSWLPLPIELELVANCTESGATVRLKPLGILPQGRELRVVITAQFEDLVGDRNIVPLDRFASMQTDAQLDHLGEAAETGDEFLEPFNPFNRSFEDTTAALDAPRGTWGDESTGSEGLQATFNFDGTGGVNGEFDVKIRSGTEVVFDTTSTMFIGGPDFSPQHSQLAIGGLLDVRHLLIEEDAILRCQGPNPVRILASGNVTVRGTLSADGSSAAPVYTLDTPNLPEPGAAGQCGGGAGGTGSYITTQVTPRGQSGFGAHQTPNLGGEGGEAGYSPSSQASDRRAGGGGGGRFGHDAVHYGDDGVTICPDEWIYGLNAESGFFGSELADSSQGPHRPYGGHLGPSPFGEAFGRVDDFFGTKRAAFDTTEERLIIGELPTPWAGAGGGAGGDATRSLYYPPPVFLFNAQDKGAGGGGGAGAIIIMALGNIVVEGSGSITAIGGHGSGGENSAGRDRLGGGSGGGAGGHIILQAGRKIDLSGALPGGEAGATDQAQRFHAINARGGQGGAGEDNQGGSDAGEQLVRKEDAKHRGTDSPSDPQDNPWIPSLPETCVAYTDALLGPDHNWVLRTAGGDGGPGLVQFHVGNLSGAPSEHDVLYPGDDVAGLRDLVWPAPHGYDELERAWVDQLLPSFGRFSKTQSTWIPLGAATVAPGSPDPDPLIFLFDGIDTATGEILRSDPEGLVEDLNPLLEPATPIEGAGLPERLSSTTVRFDAGVLAGGNEVYQRNPNLLRRFRLIIGGESYSVASAKYVGDGDLTTGEDFLDVTLTESIDVDGAPPTGLVTLVPRYFALTTDGIADSLPPSSTIQVEFQATSVNSQGAPDEQNVFPGVITWSTDIGELTGAPGNTDFRFIRYRVTFDIATIGELSTDTPRPVLEFLRIPFRF